jgi:hypothetical protein
MAWKWYFLSILSMATVTSCAHPLDQAARSRTEVRLQTLEETAAISRGACDDVGQFIPADERRYGKLTLEASAAPTARPAH